MYLLMAVNTMELGLMTSSTAKALLLMLMDLSVVAYGLKTNF